MKNFPFIAILFFALSLHAQRTISGTFSPADEYTWLIAYHLQPGTQVYVADTAITDGKFEMSIPENSPTGTFRLVYAVPQEEFNFDILYTGKEDLEFTYSMNEGPVFSKSQENVLFAAYFKEIQKAEARLISYYTNGNNDIAEYNNIKNNYMAIQNSFLERSDQLMVQEFIKANRPYIPIKYETIDQYVKNRKAHFFDVLDVNNPVLQASGFLSDKLANYIFTAIPLAQISAEETETAMRNNLKTVAEKLEGVTDKYQFSFFYSIWTQATSSGYYRLADFIRSSYLKSMASTPENQNIMAEIDLQNRLRIGAVAPEITWNDGADLHSLSKMEGHENYVLVFWSSTCGHCLRELPALHKRLKDNSSIKVVAIGIEDDDVNWKLESAKLENFEHAISLGKWDSEYADLYGIDSTPSYFILDKDKRIIDKPENDRAVIAFLEKY